MSYAFNPIAYVNMMYFQTNDKSQHVTLVQMLGTPDTPFRVTLTRAQKPKRSKHADFATYEKALDFFLDIVTEYINNIQPLQQ